MSFSTSLARDTNKQEFLVLCFYRFLYLRSDIFTNFDSRIVVFLKVYDIFDVRS